MAETLSPCPFCGGEAKFEIYGGTACAVVCQSCHCGTPTVSLCDGEDAKNRWNRRESVTKDTGQVVESDLLLDCPFCGGEAKLMSDYSSDHDHTFWQVWHDCPTNPGPIRHTYGHALGMEISTPWCASEDAAVDLWNRRAERTCRNASLDPLGFKCSECGAEDYTSDSLTMWHEGGPVDICYCPVCGARIVEVGDDDR